MTPQSSTSSPASLTSRALQPFGTTIFTTITRLANEHGAVNLAQGFPDFEGPDFIKDAAAHAMRREHNQYAPMPGLPALRQEIARRWERFTGTAVDPDSQVVVTAGCTEAIAAAIFGICNPGDEVILFEPYYDSYRACVAMAGAVPRFVALRPSTASTPGAHATAGASEARGAFTFDPNELRRAFGPRTRAILVNTPHNPTGKVFTRAELELIADLCRQHGIIAICDEVYERLIFEPSRLPHVRLATLPGMADRTITLSSLGKTFSLTGWKIGWSVASPALTAALRSAHQFLTFAVATPLQWGAAEALRREDEYVPSLIADLSRNRDRLAAALTELGFGVHQPDGTYFILADHSAISSRLGLADDAAFCQHLIKNVGVAAIPPSVFYERTELGRPLARFAFCKKDATIEEGIRRLRGMKG